MADYEKFEKEIEKIIDEYYGIDGDNRAYELREFLINMCFAETIASIAEECNLIK